MLKIRTPTTQLITNKKKRKEKQKQRGKLSSEGTIHQDDSHDGCCVVP